MNKMDNCNRYNRFQVIINQVRGQISVLNISKKLQGSRTEKISFPKESLIFGIHCI
jgi:hypothetical protein